MLRRFAPALCVFLIGSAARAQASELAPEAKAHLDRGLELYAQKRFAEAIDEFERGYASDPKPELLYAKAQAERLSGNCAAASVSYQKFLDEKPEPEREAAARANLARCQDELRAQTKTETPRPAPAPAAAPPPKAAPQTLPPPAPKPTPPTRRAPPKSASPWYTDAFGDALLGAGVVATTLGGYFLWASYAAEAQAKDAGTTPSDVTYDEHRDRIERAERQRTLGVVGAGVGLGLVTGAILRYALRAPDSPDVGFTVSPTWAGASVRHRF